MGHRENLAGSHSGLSDSHFPMVHGSRIDGSYVAVKWRSQVADSEEGADKISRLLLGKKVFLMRIFLSSSIFGQKRLQLLFYKKRNIGLN